MALTTLLQRLTACLFPPPIQRSAEQQAEVDRQTRQLSLYQYRSCPYCARVRRAIHQLALTIETRDIHRQRQYQRELVEGGGRYQVPCLRIAHDDGKVEWLYESADIVAYLKRRFGEANRAEQ